MTQKEQCNDVPYQNEGRSIDWKWRFQLTMEMKRGKSNIIVELFSSLAYG